MYKINSMFAAIAAFLLVSACSSSPATDNISTYHVTDYIDDGVFTQGVEGPAIGPDGHLYVVNFEREGTIGQVISTPEGKGEARLFVELPKGSVGNGIRFDTEGFMYVADYLGHNILRIDMTTKAVEIYAHNQAMNQPNDIAISAAGVLYASDPKWADNSGQLWRIDRDGSTHLLQKDMGTTNGIEISADEKHLYVNESVQSRVWVFDLLANGDLANKRLLIDFNEHGMDGMRSDSQGNLYIARYGAGVIAVVSPAGELLREVPLKGKKPTNLAFGGDDGKTVYVTLQERGAIEMFRAEYPGRAYIHRSQQREE